MEESKKTFTIQTGMSSFNLDVLSVASINSTNCVNCGDCRDICPVFAITEQQRVICRLCPTCTDQPAMLHDDMVALATKESCTSACPLDISPQGYINLTAAGKEREAFLHIWKHNPLPSVCGRICHHPCEQVCKRGTLVDEPIAIRSIKRYLSDTFDDYIPDKYPVIFQEEIAVIGAGPAGLMAAHNLSLLGYRVTVFDKEPVAGGMLNKGIPKFRIPKNIIERDIKKLEQAGMRFRLNTSISRRQIAELKKNFDKIIVATGTPYSKVLPIEGYKKEGIYTALNFMERVNNHQPMRSYPGQEFIDNGNVVVIGGGNVALDCARTAIRLGAKSVTAVCLECGCEVPCHPWEREEAEAEGVKLMEAWAPKRFLGEQVMLNGVELNKVISFSKSEKGEIKFNTDAEQKITLPADCVIVAIGQQADELWKDFEDDDMFLFAGDLSENACSVIDAMASGKKAAAKADEMLQKRRIRNIEHELHTAPVEERIYPATRLKVARPATPVAPLKERISTFTEVEVEYGKDIVDIEVKRCLQCGYSKIDTSRCIGCGACITVCPKGDVISMVRVEKGGNENV